MELEAEKRKAVQLSYVDTLTKLNNRRAYYERSLSVHHDAQNKACHYAVIILDIDYFKNINDTYGHAIGDEVLKTLANVLKNNLRENDVEGRIGGEEFAITLIDTTLENATNIAKKLCQEIENITLLGYDNIHVTASFGVSEYHINSKEFEDILDTADHALYQAKLSGRNNVNTLTFDMLTPL